MIEEHSAKHDEGIQWWKQFKSYTRHNKVNELWQYFNVREWWNSVGQQYHPNIKMVAAINLVRPYSTVQQEHDFSMATCYGRNLVQRQKNLTLEKMLVGSLN